MMVDEACVVLCRKVHKKHEIQMFKDMIDQEYRVHWYFQEYFSLVDLHTLSFA